MQFFRILAGSICLLCTLPLVAADDAVRWLGDYKEALQEARRTGKPIFLEYRCEP